MYLNKNLISVVAVLVLTMSVPAFAGRKFGNPSQGRGVFDQAPEEIVQEIISFLDAKSLDPYARSCQANFNSSEERMNQLRTKYLEGVKTFTETVQKDLQAKIRKIIKTNTSINTSTIPISFRLKKPIDSDIMKTVMPYLEKYSEPGDLHKIMNSSFGLLPKYFFTNTLRDAYASVLNKKYSSPSETRFLQIVNTIYKKII